MPSRISRENESITNFVPHIVKMVTASAEWEKTLAEATAKDSDVTPGVVLAAVSKNGKPTRRSREKPLSPPAIHS